jgi:hypothetical protein
MKFPSNAGKTVRRQCTDRGNGRSLAGSQSLTVSLSWIPALRGSARIREMDDTSLLLRYLTLPYLTFHYSNKVGHMR